MLRQKDEPLSHYFLVQSESCDKAVKQAERFLQASQLISYVDLVIHKNEVLSAMDERFNTLLLKAVEGNMDIAQEMLERLKSEGVSTLDELLTMKEGYLTKILHTLTHILDGFIGIDTVLYNLVEDSHRVSSVLFEKMKVSPQEYWLVPIYAGEVQASVLPSQTDN